MMLTARHAFLLNQPPSSPANNPQRLKASLWFSVGKIVDEESLRLNANATPQFIGALTEMVWAQIGKESFFFHPLSMWFISLLIPPPPPENVAIDLESFARHAGRSTISPDDVLLVTRRNEALHGMIRDFIERGQAGKGKTGRGGGAKNVGVGGRARAKK
jgi:centromere protein S